LINKTSNEAKESPIPPPGPFVVPQPNGNFTEIQPPFVSLVFNNKNGEEKMDKGETNGTVKEEQNGDGLHGKYLT
jgi:hypothetical protein